MDALLTEALRLLATVLDAVSGTIAAHPWVGVAIPLLPGLPGVAYRSLKAIFVGAMFGLLGLFTGLVLSPLLLLFWILGWILAISAGRDHARSRVEKRRHQALLRSIRGG